ncbi:MAG: SagB/ThcOx family dehydrogenase [Desulfococcaceae bacterium]
MDKNAKEVFRYHEESKHHFHRFARSAGYMDWKNQPNPFRFYKGSEPVSFPLLKTDPAGKYMDLYQRGKNPVRPFTLENISGFLELSLGLSAWKSAGAERWPLRINPSSGNLHPEEAHIILPAMEYLPSGLYHYNSFLHAAEPRATVPAQMWEKIRHHFQTEVFLIGLSSIFWRESWKYGERAFRYCHLDTGHALAAMSFSAGLMGWKLSSLDTLSHADMEMILGFDRTQWRECEAEEAEILCAVHAFGSEIPHNLPDDIIGDFSALSVQGIPNALSSRPIRWDIIYNTAECTRKPRTLEIPCNIGSRPFRKDVISTLPAAKIIRSRRSVSAFSTAGRMDREIFFAILDKTVPRKNSPPFDAETENPRVHLLIFVHRVDGLEPGIYFFLRAETDLSKIRSRTSEALLWQQITEDFPLYLLQKGDAAETAVSLSCDQAIAGNSVFSLGMLAEFKSLVEKEPFRYRDLFRECGMTGQVLYLEAEAHGFRGTGIGCFFDDPVHELIGLKDNSFQSLYHFTVGKAVEDKRISTLPPYEHLKPETGL